MRDLAIIPARSGSKGLPNKNIRFLGGKPLMAYTIEAALQSGRFDEVMVSTDSFEYMKIAKQYGASVPFIRSEETASDHASSWDMVREVLDCYSKVGRHFDTVCLLQPTCPLRTAVNIIEAYQMFEEKSAVAVVSLCEMEHSPLWANTLNEEKSLNGFVSRANEQPRQALDKYYRFNGAIYIVDIEEFMKDDYIYREGSYGYIMEKENSIDIDDEVDFRLAEALLNKKI